jgi:hypothetical protein
MQAFLQFAIGKDINSSAIFLVVKDLVRPVVLGMDWLLSVNASLDLHQSLLSLDSNGAQFSIPFHVDAVVCDPEASANVTCSALSVRGLPIQLAKSVTPLSVLKEKVEAISSLTDSQRQDLFRVLSNHQVVFNELPVAPTSMCMSSKCTTPPRS